MRCFHPKRMFRNIVQSLHDVVYYSFLFDRRIIEKTATEQLGYVCNLRNPVSFNDKINWLKLHDNPRHAATLIDKETVKHYVAGVIGPQFIIPTIAAGYKSASEIDWDALPERFVIKCNHDSGSAMVCRDKSSFDREAAVKILDVALSRNPGLNRTRAIVCKKIKPSILIEELIEPEGGGDLRDYKFFCFGGKVRCFKVDFGRAAGEHRANYYSPQGELLPFGEQVCLPDMSKEINLPVNLQEMIGFAEKLAASVNRAFLRVDLYNTGSRIYFGELTYYPAGGYGKFIPEEWDMTLGNWIEL